MSFYDAIRVGASGAADDFIIDRSLRFNDGDNIFLNRTPSSNGNRQIWTFSVWIKPTHILSGTAKTFFSAGSVNPDTIIKFDSDRFEISRYDGGYTNRVTSTRVLRDPSAWYHLVGAVDTTQGTASNRVKMYVNGTQVTDFANSSYPSQNFNYELNSTSYATFIGKHPDGQYFDGFITEFNFVDGQQLTPSSFAETKATTGQWVPKDTSALTFGTNGFRLNFSDNSGTTATTLGKDSSGNGNNFTPNNFSVAAGVENDSYIDTPTDNFCILNPTYRTSGRTPPNYFNATLEINNTGGGDMQAHGTFAVKSGKYYFEGIPTGVSTSGGGTHFIGVQESSPGHVNQGYWRNPGTVYNQSASGSDIGTSYDSNDVIGVAFDADTGKVWFAKNNTFAGSGDPANGNNPAYTYSTPDHLTPAFGFDNTSSGKKWFANFGQRPFTYTPPTGYVALSSANLTDPTVLLPNNHFNTVLYTGTGSDLAVTGVGFQADWVWIKNRSNAGNWHDLYDSVRGVTKRIFSNETAVEQTEAQGLKAFSSDGFTVGNNSDVGSNGNTYVAWNWNAGSTDGATYTVKVVSDSGNKYRFNDFGTSAVTLDLAEGGTYIFNMDDSSNATHPFSIGTAANGTVYTSGITYFLDGVSKTYSQYTSGFAAATTRRLHITVPGSAPQLYYWCSAHSGMGGAINTNSTLGSSNFAGSIQSTAKVNASAGFSIVTFTGTGSNATVGHGLGVTPQAFILKGRNFEDHWRVYHQGVGTSVSDSNRKALKLNDLGVYQTSTSYWNDTSPTSTTVSLGTDQSVNKSTGTFVMYCFSEIDGYSKFGKYTGNSNADGTYVYTGFKPAWIIIKRSDGGSDPWLIHDSTRDPDNVVQDNIFASAADAEFDTDSVDFLSNGFKWRINSGLRNNNTDNYIYFAFAEIPFKNARGR